MNRRFKYASLLALVMTAFFSGQAQQKLQMKLGYDVNTPVGASFRNSITNTSFRGANGEITYSINSQLNVGLGVSFSDFYQKYPRQVYSTKNGDISAVLTNSIQTTPVLAKVNYNLTKEGTVRPYVGLGAGLNIVNYNQYLGEFPNSKTSVHPAVSGDAGINIPLSKTKAAGLNLGANFNYLPFNFNDLKNLNNWGLHAGVFFPLR